MSTFVGATRSTWTNDDSRFQSIAKPSGAASGDLALVMVAAPYRTITMPAGWTQLFVLDTTIQSNRVTVFRRVLGSSEPSTWDFTLDAASLGSCHAIVYRGALVPTVWSTQTTESTETITVPGVTVSKTNSIVLAYGGYMHYAGTIGVPTGTTSRGHNGGTAKNRIADYIRTSTGSSGAKTFSHDAPTSKARSWVGFQILLTPSNAPPTAPTNLVPKSNQTLNPLVANTFSWKHNDPDGDAQNGLQIRYRKQGTSSWTTMTAVTSSTQSRSIAAGTFGLGSWEWQVRTRDPSQEWGPYSASATFKINTAPTAPTNPSFAGATLNRTVSNKLTWTFNDPNAGDTQSRFIIYLSGASTITVDQNSTAREHTFAPSTLANGTYTGTIRTYDAAGAISPHSAQFSFTVATPEGAPTVIAPVHEGVIDEPLFRVEWSAPEQTHYQIRVYEDDDGSASQNAIWDSGIIADSVARHLDVSFPTNGMYRWVYVRIQKDGLWGAWATVRALVSYTPPTLATLITGSHVEGNRQVAIQVDVEYAPHTGDLTDTHSHDLHRRVSYDDGLTWVDERVLAVETNEMGYTDGRVEAHARYQYRADAISTTGAKTIGEWTE